MNAPLTRPFSIGAFPEMDALQTLVARAGPALRSEVLCEVDLRGERLPLLCLELGSRSPDAAAVGFFGGVHGVERIGTQVLIAWLESLIERLQWDDSLHALLERVRLLFVPLINPGGMLSRTRCNPAGVDLMRNAPVDADHRVHWLLGGHRISPHLPWYRGAAGEPMQPEAQAVCDVVEQRLLPHAFSLSLDCHSGFGIKDRIWFPYALSHQPIECLPELYALRTMFRASHPYHSIYRIEPQADQYTTHGDLWDYLYDRSRIDHAPGSYLPLTLEMGSWLWIKKSPAQLFSMLGMFNPLAPHRHQRILRTHISFFEFLVRAASAHRRWRPQDTARQALNDAALAYWYQAQRSLPAPARLQP